MMDESMRQGEIVVAGKSLQIMQTAAWVALFPEANLLGNRWIETVELGILHVGNWAWTYQSTIGWVYVYPEAVEGNLFPVYIPR